MVANGRVPQQSIPEFAGSQKVPTLRFWIVVVAVSAAEGVAKVSARYSYLDYTESIPERAANLFADLLQHQPASRKYSAHGGKLWIIPS
jgi:hypothetical protein